MFRKHLAPLALALAAAVLFGRSACADSMNLSAIPEDARWVIHFDVDAATKTPLWELVRKRFIEPRRPQISAPLHTFEAITGLHLPQDLHDITLFGTTFDESTCCLLIHAPFDQEKTTNFLKRAQEFNTLEHNGHTLLTWRDKDRDQLIYAAFAPGDIAILSTTPKMVGVALDTLDGKSGSLKATSPIVPPTAPGMAKSQPILWLSSMDLGELPQRQKVDSPFLAQMDTASFGIGISEERLYARLAVLAKNDKVAQQLYASAEGIRAMVTLVAADEHATVRQKMLAGAMQNLVLTTDGKAITADWSIGMDKIEAVLEMARPNPATTSPETNQSPAGGVLMEKQP
jgi:hypothetical protein